MESMLLDLITTAGLELTTHYYYPRIDASLEVDPTFSRGARYSLNGRCRQTAKVMAHAYLCNGTWASPSPLHERAFRSVLNPSSHRVDPTLHAFLYSIALRPVGSTRPARRHLRVAHAIAGARHASSTT